MISLSILFFFFAISISYGSKDNAISLKVIVGPWNNSRKEKEEKVVFLVITSSKFSFEYALEIAYSISSSLKSSK